MIKKYYGLQTEQAVFNFPFSKNPVPYELILSIVEIKKAAAIVNHRLGNLAADVKKAIVITCDEILTGKYKDQFITPGLQGGAGTSINMNVNEVIANRATEILQNKGNKVQIHPNDHVNMSQSTNDVNPSALKIACIKLVKDLLATMDKVISIFNKKGDEFINIPKLGRTHLQDAVPMKLSDEFYSYRDIISRDCRRIEDILNYFYDLNLGGTAIGNSINASKKYIQEVYQELSVITKLNLRQAENFMSQTSSQTDFCMLSQALVLLSLDMSKIASDIRLLSSGPRGGFSEIHLVELQPGSSIMPGKVNPVLAESVNQLYFLVSGHNLTIEHSAHASQLELGVMFPILSDRIILSLKLTQEIIFNFAVKCVDSIKADKKNCQSYLEKSSAYATLLTPKLGYNMVSKIVKESIKTGNTVRELVIKKRLMSDEQFEKTIRNYGF